MKTHRAGRRSAVAALIAAFLLSTIGVLPVAADTTPQSIPFSQAWGNTGLITTDDDWSGVPGIIGHRGDGLTAGTGVDPQTVLVDDIVVDVNANQTNPNTFTTGGVAEFHIADPVVALQGSGTARAPYLTLSLNATGQSNINVAYNLRDIDGSADNAVQPVAVQFRVGDSGPYTNIPAGFVADATTGPSLATLVTHVGVTLPAVANGQPLVNVRIITTDAVGSDEWVGIDDITASTVDLAPAVQSTTPANNAAGVAVGSNVSITFTEPVDVVDPWFTIACGTSSAHPAVVTGGPTTFTLNPDQDFVLSESCTVTVVAAQVTDQDTDDPLDAMVADHVFRFATADPSVDLVINEIDYDQASTDTAEFFEIKNVGASAESLNGVSVGYINGNGGGAVSYRSTALPDVSLAAGDYFVVCANALNTPNCDLDVTPETDLIQNGSPDALVLLSGATIVDTVSYEGETGAPYTEGTGAGTDTAVGFESLSRCPDGSDTDNNSADFLLRASTPGVSNTCPGDDVAPSVASTVPTNGAIGVAMAANITINFSEPVDVTGAWFTIQCALSGPHTATPSGGPQTFTLDPTDDFAENELCTLTVVGSLVTDQDANDPPDEMTGNHVVTFTTVDLELCGDTATLIHDIQGPGAASPLVGQSHPIEGVVVGDYQGGGTTGLAGFFVQEEDSDADADAATSEGIFVFDGSFGVGVAAGDHVRVRGTVAEFNSLTELNAVSLVLVCSTGNSVTPTTRTLPVAAIADWEPVEGMLVTINDELTVTETFTLGRFGEVALSVGGRLSNPTNVVDPGAPAIALQDLNDRSRILLDDGRGGQNADPTTYPTGGLSASNTLRIGDTIAGPLTGVLDFEFNLYRIQPVGPIGFNATNPRPAAPAPVGGNIRVASFNVLNYFNGDGLGGGFPTPRGANTPLEFGRQRDKIVSAIVALDADIVGLMELENDATPNSAIEDLVAGLNASAGGGTYAFIDTGVVGGDEIRVALIYKPGSVTPVGAYEILDSSVDPAFIDTLNRPVLAQTFERNATGARLTVAVNHLKSKGSACPDDPDTGDGQGNCNLTRTAAAGALVDWLATDPTGADDPDVLIIGDLNSYALEDPITTIRDAGYTNLIADALGDEAYSYVFGGQSGYLDHALASPSVVAQTTGVTEWHINADEPVVLDYNTEFKSANHIITLYAPDAYRSSDHDPVLVGLDLDPSVDAGGPYTVNEGGSVDVTATGSRPDGQGLTYAWDLDNDDSFETPGQSVAFSAATIQAPATLTIRVRVTDADGLFDIDDATVTVIWAFGGFEGPLGGGSVNNAKAGANVPVKFSLGGDQGLDIFREGYPTSGSYTCGTTPPSDATQPITIGGSGLQYSSASDEYSLQWKTDKNWKNTCRVFVLGLRDGTNIALAFQFK